MMGWFLAWLGLIIAQRIVELVIAKRNEKRALARGAVESGKSHYLLIVSLHVAWFVGLIVEGALTDFQPLDSPWADILFSAWVGLQAIRFWILWALGPSWNTRVLVIPGDKRVVRGPYRIMKHPNYVVVILELAIVPLTFGLWWTAILATVLNAVLMMIRIPIESRALKALSRD